MIRRGRKAKGGVKKGPRGGDFTITGSGKKQYVSNGPKKVPTSTAVKKPFNKRLHIARSLGTAALLGAYISYSLYNAAKVASYGKRAHARSNPHNIIVRDKITGSYL